MKMEVFPPYVPEDRQVGLYEVLDLSGGRSSAFTLMSLINGGFHTDNPFNIVNFQNTGLEHESCYNFLNDIENHTGIKINWLEYTLTEKFINELVFSSFSYDKFFNCEYTNIGQILNIKKLRSLKYEKSPNSFWYKDGYSHKKDSIREVDFASASRNGKPFTDVFLYKCAIRIMKGEGLLLPSVGQRWCTGDMKEKVSERWLSNKGITEYIAYKGMRFDEPNRVEKMWLRNDRQDKIWYDCPLHYLLINKIDVLMAWSIQPFDLQNFIDAFGNCLFCHLKALIKKQWLIQNGHSVNWYKQTELLANDYNEDTDAMSRQHGTYQQIENSALNIPPISIEQVLSDQEKEISCFNCGD